MIITLLIIVLCLALIGVILIQNPKGGGLSSSFGSANQFAGVKQTMEGIEKITWGLAVLIVVLSMISSTINAPKQTNAVQTGQEKQGQQP